MPPFEHAPSPVVVSLVIRMRDDLPSQEGVLAELRARTEITVGMANGPWLPVVAETGAPEGLHAWLESLPGVAFVDVTFVEVVADSAAAPCSGDFSQEPNLK